MLHELYSTNILEKQSVKILILSESNLLTQLSLSNH